MTKKLTTAANGAKHDVFLSFRGEDTRDNFTSHLHAALLRSKIQTYIDNKLESGDQIGPALRKAIEESQISVIIFSANYASSTWCLDELVHILDCNKRYGRFVIPVFYGVDPSHVRRQNGSYEAAFALLEERFEVNTEMVDQWRVALTYAANLSGFDSSKIKPESKLVEDIVEAILAKVNHRSATVWKGLVGMKSRVWEIERLMCLDSLDVRTVGIWGMGGIGKTTLARAVYDHLSLEFEACCFVGDIREVSETRLGLNDLQHKLFGVLLDEENMNTRSSHAMVRLQRKKVLVVLDDVNDSRQLKALAGDHDLFGRGSRIIITTRDMQLLQTGGANEIYKVNQLNEDEALQLFEVHAFKNVRPTSEFTELSRTVVSYANGIPLVLEVLGSQLHCKRKREWESKLTKLQEFPDKRIHDVLKVSYDGLDWHEKDMFLEIACFYKGENIDYAKRMLDTCGFFVDEGIRVLTDISLISITSNYLRMHDILQEMGRAIVREQCIKEPGKRSRLWIAKDVCQVFRTNTGTATLEAIFLDMSKITKLQVSGAAFTNMHSLRLLKVYKSGEKHCKMYLPEGLHSLPDALRYLYWDGYPLKSLPSEFFPENLVELHLPNSQVEQLWTEDQDLGKLRKLNLSYSKYLTRVPDLSESSIESIELQYCTSLAQIPTYFQDLDTLASLNLCGCSNVKNLPEIPGIMTTLCLHHSGIEELPASVWSSKNLVSLDLMYCQELEKLPSSTCILDSLQILGLLGCSSLRSFSELPRNIRHLCLTQTAIEEVPSSIGYVSGLISLQLEHCKNFVRLPASISWLKSLERLTLLGCCKFKDFPEILEPMERLEFLNLSKTAIEELPMSIDKLVNLKSLELSMCKNLRFVPNSIFKTKNLVLKGCGKLHFLELAPPLPSFQGVLIQKLNFSRYNFLREIPEFIHNLSSLRSLNICGVIDLSSGPENISCNSIRLESSSSPLFSLGWRSCEALDLSPCNNLSALPRFFDICLPLFFNLEEIWAISCRQYCEAIDFCKDRIQISKKSYNLCLGYLTKFRSLPEIISPVLSLRHLLLSRMGIRELPWSIENLIGLVTLEIEMCENLEIVPSSTYNLNSLQCLILFGCSKLKKLPTFSGGFPSLNRLDLSYCSMLEIPDGLISISSLQSLNLSGSLIERLPASMTQVSRLKYLYLGDCNRLQFLPEIALVLEHLVEHGCCGPSETVSSMRTRLGQACDLELMLSYCLEHVQNVWSDMRLDTQLRIIFLMAASSVSKKHQMDHEGCALVYPGSNIPKWFRYQREDFSIQVKLPPHWFDTNFLGFALSVAYYDHYAFISDLGFGCNFHFRTSNGEITEFDLSLNNWGRSRGSYRFQSANDARHVVMWYVNPFKGDRAKWSTRLNDITEAFFQFNPPSRYKILPVGNCAVDLLYAEDAAKFGCFV